MRTLHLLLILSLLSFTISAPAADSLLLLPAQISLTGPEARQSLLVEKSDGTHFTGQLTNAITFTTSDPKIARLDGTTVIPVANGSATIRATVNGETLSAPVTVSKMDAPFAWSFRNHIQPVLTKSGCNAGACHGAAAGQNGFRVSLRGYDDDGDHTILTRGAMNRRITLADPARSLLLLKSTATIPHKGGERFKTGSFEYRVLAEWIAAGAPGPRPDDARITRLEVLPPAALLQPGATQQLSVRATFSDGHVEDVTRWAKFNAVNTSVAGVDESGRVTVSGHGETTVSAWFLSQLAITTITSPYAKPVPASLFTSSPRRNFIDDLVLEKLRELNLPPSPRSTDSEFLRRAFLDTIGVPPSADETRAFLADRSAGKRDALIDSLLARPEFIDYWSYRWSDLLLVNSDKLPPTAMWAYYNWIRKNVAANTPWDRFVRDLVTATGSTLDHGAGNFYILHDEPTKMAETVSVAFLGFSINCAKCHNHPLEKWTNDEYFGFANLFARTRSKRGVAPDEQIIFSATEGDLVQPLTGRPQAPKPLDAAPISLTAKEDRRAPLAAWLTSPQNDQFSKTIVNRIWANFFGLGLVESVDDIRVANPASNEKLFTAAAAHLVKNQFDLKALMRTILQSETYQRSSLALPENQADTRYLARFYPRRLKAEVLLDAFSAATAVPTTFRIDARNANRGLGRMYPEGFRALQLPDSNVASYFLKSFGRPERLATCECERTSEPSMAQALHLANGDTLNDKLAKKGNRLDQLLAKKMSDQELLEETYLLTLNRPPTPAEKAKLTQILATAADRRPALEDLFWSLLSSREFLFNH
ncbi:S-layer protein [Verrucomicrobiota bacterium]|nr:S-layer protein [Verrucomicrobiota bacterium]